MTETILQLEILSQNLPTTYSARTVSLLDNALTKFISLLNYVNGYNDDLKVATAMYYNEISAMRDTIQQCIYANLQTEKEEAFAAARKELQRSIDALAALVTKRQQEAVALT